MLKIQRFVVNPLEENCYVVSDETGEACIIDCGCFFEEEWRRIKSYIDGEHLSVVHVLCTHAHFDHVMGLGMIYRDLAIAPEMAEEDKSLYESVPAQLALFGLPEFDIPVFPPMRSSLKHGQWVSFGNHSFDIISTPGHTPGGLCLYMKEENVLFSGDTLFCGSMGRTDLPGGSYRQLMESLTDKLFQLPEETRVLTGHGPDTTIGREASAW